MSGRGQYRARQIAAIRDAVSAARQALRSEGRFDPVRFAEVFIAEGGVQIPGRPDEHEAARELGIALREALARGERHHAEDANLQREIRRAVAETCWAEAMEDDTVVGFYLDLPPAALDSPTAEALSHENHGLGPGVFRKADVVVLQPACDGARFIPVREHEIEC